MSDGESAQNRSGSSLGFYYCAVGALLLLLLNRWPSRRRRTLFDSDKAWGSKKELLFLLLYLNVFFFSWWRRTFFCLSYPFFFLFFIWHTRNNRERKRAMTIACTLSVKKKLEECGFEPFRVLGFPFFLFSSIKWRVLKQSHLGNTSLLLMRNSSEKHTSCVAWIL